MFLGPRRRTVEIRETQPPSLLLVDDDEVFRERLARAFRGRGFEVRTAGDVGLALSLAREDTPELAVVDLRMPGGSGLDLVRELKALDPSTEVVVLTGYGSIATAVEATKRGASNYLPKPADADDILQAFARGRGDGDGESLDPDGALRAPSLARAEWEHIHRVLGDCSGNISEAARRLGIHRRSLQRKLQKFAPD
jgi:two-component system response regulator RegA